MKYFVFDVESAGLYGEGFAVGYVVFDDYSFLEVASGWKSSGLYSVGCKAEDSKWLHENLPYEVLNPDYKMSVKELHEWFEFELKKFPDACLVSDCAFPVEMNFLKACKIQPYPLHEVATALLMAGRDPVGTYGRKPTELPKHHPLCDARQSGRVFMECIAYVGLKEVPVLGFTSTNP